MGPKKIIAELVDECHLRCALCWNRSRRGSGRQMSLETAAKVLNRYDDPIYEIVWYNWGEPLLHRKFEVVAEMIGKSKARNVISSSLSLALTDERLESLNNFDCINVALSGMTPDIYKIYHTNGAFDLVMKNIKRLAELKLSQVTLIWLNHKHNTFQMPLVQEFAVNSNFALVGQGLNCCVEDLVSNFDHELLRVPKYPYLGNSCRIQNWDPIDTDGNYLLCCTTHNIKIGYSINDEITRFPFPRNKVLKEARLKTPLCITCRENEYWRMF